MFIYTEYNAAAAAAPPPPTTTTTTTNTEHWMQRITFAAETNAADTHTA